MLWTLTFVSVLIVSFAGYHHHHGTEVCLTFRHERTSDVCHCHTTCADASTFLPEAFDSGLAGGDVCHRHCTTRICSAHQYAALRVSRLAFEKLQQADDRYVPADLFLWENVFCCVGIGPDRFPSPPYVSRFLCSSGGEACGLRAPPVFA